MPALCSPARRRGPGRQRFGGSPVSRAGARRAGSGQPSPTPQLPAATAGPTVASPTPASAAARAAVVLVTVVDDEDVINKEGLGGRF